MNARARTERLKVLLSKEQHSMADFLVELADFDERREWEEMGYASLFDFLHRELKLSKGASYYRQVGARLVRRHPEVLEALRDGRLCITSLAEVVKVLTPENCAAVLPKFFHCSSREARFVAAEVNPVQAAPRREVVTSTATIVPQLASAQRDDSGLPPTGLVQALEPTPLSAQPTAVAGIAKLSTIEPLSAEDRRLHLTVTREFLAKLDRARDGMSNAYPTATGVFVLEAALDLLLEKQAKARGGTEKQRRRRRRRSSRTSAATVSEPAPPADPRYIPQAVKDAVWVRDGGCCAFPAADGEVCGSTRNLEWDHIRPIAHGGLSTVDNVRLLCHRHNQLWAQHCFGKDWMKQFRRQPVARETEAVYGAPACAARSNDLTCSPPAPRQLTRASPAPPPPVSAPSTARTRTPARCGRCERGRPGTSARGPRAARPGGRRRPSTRGWTPRLASTRP